MQNWAAPSDDAAWRMRFSWTKCWASSSPRSIVPEHGVGSDADVGQRHLGVVGRHVERPPEELDLETGRIGRHEEGGDSLRVAAGSPLVRAKMMSWVAWCSPLFHRFIPLSTHSSPSRTAVVSRYVASLPWFGSVSPKASRRVPSRKPGIQSATCSRCAEVAHHQHGREVADDRRLVLQVVVQAEPPRRQVFADDRHLQVRGVATTEFGGQRQAQPAGGIGAAPHLANNSSQSARGTPPLSKSVLAHSRR